jgi:hypothetical protein
LGTLVAVGQVRKAAVDRGREGGFIVYGESRARYEVRSASGSRMEKDIFTTAPLEGFISVKTK